MTFRKKTIKGGIWIFGHSFYCCLGIFEVERIARRNFRSPYTQANVNLPLE
ncbi:hypothetical protein NPIL_635611, partial [Nephila pilipes]